MSTPLRVARRLVLFAIALAVLTWLVALFAVVLWSRRDTARPASAIVVLGAAQYAGHPSPVLRARIEHAVALFERGLAPRIIFTGGTGVGDTTSEAAVGRKFALRRGIPDSAILLESEGRTSSESLRAVAAIMRAHRMRNAILVSDPFHMARLRVLAHQFGIVPFTSPTPSSPISASGREWRYMVSESLKVPVAYFTPPERR